MSPSTNKVHLLNMVSPVTLLAVAVALLAIRRIHWELTVGRRRRKMIRENGCEPPIKYQNKGIMGKLFGTDVINEIMKTAKQGRMHQASRIRNYSTQNTIQHRLLMRDAIMTIEPENVKTILSTKFNDFSLGSRRADIFIPVLGHGIFDTDGAAWERSRALVRPNFTRHQVADLDALEKHVKHLIDRVPHDGSTIDLQELFFSLTMDSATDFLFGKSTNILAPGEKNVEAEEFVKAFVYSTHAMATQFQSAGLTKYIPDREFSRNVKTIHKFADDIIRDATRQVDLEKSQPRAEKEEEPGKKQRYIFLHALLSQTRDPYTLRSELLNILLAGRDTTAGLLSCTWHVLARRPDIYAKLRAEVEETVGDKHQLPDYAAIKEMKYLRYILAESLRLMPVVPGNTRVARVDTVLPLGGGRDGQAPLFVPAGTAVNYHVWSMHRRTDFYGADSLDFRPERWETLRPGWEYLPFNGGPRICVGQQFALMEASYTTVRLVQEFSKRGGFSGGVEGRDGREWSEFLTLTLASGTGCWVGFPRA